MVVLNLKSLNIHGLNNSEEYLHKILKDTDLLFIQEHWQFTKDFYRLNSLSDTHSCFATDSMKEAAGDGLMSGRPYGGVACYWSNKFGSSISPILETGNPRVSALLIKSEPVNTIVFNLYMPYLNSSNRLQSIDDYLDTISCIESVIDSYSGANLIVAGDLNFELGTNSPFENIFIDFCTRYNLTFCDSHFNDSSRSIRSTHCQHSSILQASLTSEDQ